MAYRKRPVARNGLNSITLNFTVSRLCHTGSFLQGIAITFFNGDVSRPNKFSKSADQHDLETRKLTYFIRIKIQCKVLNIKHGLFCKYRKTCSYRK